jgi:uncharacterized protein with HEPN domain
MAPRSWRLRIGDILASIQVAREITAGLTFEEYRANREKSLAVERCLEIIGEAARYIPPEVQSRHPGVPWGEMRGMRNIVAHAYFDVIPVVIWDTVQKDLPQLALDLQRVLTIEHDESGDTAQEE